MFSDAERELLRLLAHGSSAARSEALQRRFPNPAYRRRLLWGIRRKAAAASADWELFTNAARNEPRVVRPTVPLASGADVPTYTEPIAALFEGLAARLRTSRHRRAPVRRGHAP